MPLVLLLLLLLLPMLLLLLLPMLLLLLLPMLLLLLLLPMLLHQECARYIETFKGYESRPASSIKERTDTDYLGRLSNSLTTIRGINRSGGGAAAAAAAAAPP